MKISKIIISFLFILIITMGAASAEDANQTDSLTLEPSDTQNITADSSLKSYDDLSKKIVESRIQLL